MKRYLPAHLNKQLRRETRSALRDELEEVAESENAIDYLLHENFEKGNRREINSTDFERGMVKLAKRPVQKANEKNQLRNTWTQTTGISSIRNKSAAEKNKRKILAKAFLRVVQALTHEECVLMACKLEDQLRPESKRDKKRFSALTKAWETWKISKLMDRISNRLSKDEKSLLAPHFFERLKATLLEQAWKLSKSEEELLTKSLDHAVKYFNTGKTTKFNALKKNEKQLVQKKKDLSAKKKTRTKKSQKTTKKELATLGKKIKAVKRKENRVFKHKKETPHFTERLARKDVRKSDFEVKKSPRKQTPGELKKIAKRAQTKERNERAPIHMTIEERNHKMLKRVPITRPRSAKYYATKRK